MHVIATAGHVDHGKSTLVHRLTSMQPDRLEEERRRGLSIELGFCWADLPPAGEVAFVDVPGHERFVATMLAGLGSVPAVLLVVAADDEWMPQTAEHLAAIDALSVRHGVVAVTRADLVDPGPAMERARAEVDRTSLSGAPVVAVSAASGEGIDDLTVALTTMLRAMPPADPEADVRFWVDRRFSVPGSGTVVTGTLPEGRIRPGDSLEVRGHPVRVRGVQSLSHDVPAAEGPARVALNLAGNGVEDLQRGDVLVTPGAWHAASVVDVRVHPAGVAASHPGQTHRLPDEPLLHVGAAAVSVRYRPLGTGHARLTLPEPLPLRVGDRALLRDPGSRAVWGVQVLDPAPPSLRRRGAADRRGHVLSGLELPTTMADEVDRRGVVRRSLLHRIGVAAATASAPVASADDWLMSPEFEQRARERLGQEVRRLRTGNPLSHGLPLRAAATTLGLPSASLVMRLVALPLRVVDGRIISDDATGLPAALVAAVGTLVADLADDPFAAPSADRLREFGLDAKSLAAAERAGLLLRVSPNIVLLPGADEEALRRFRNLPQPFTMSEARAALETTRRVAMPVLDHLDRTGRTLRLPDDRRSVR